MGIFGDDDQAALRHRLDRIEAMLAAVMDHLGVAFDPGPPGPGDMTDEARALALAGRKIDAIRKLREQTGAGLAEAKALVDRIEPD